MATKEEVQSFLQNFITKMSIWGIVYRDQRGKNAQALLDLEITPHSRKAYLEQLKYTDYSEGPLEEVLNGGADMWVFGMNIQGKEVYIKITLGWQGRPVICISFHAAEYPMHYPYK
jgi:hypothetical protein